jgi:hypothetical protein
MSAESQKCSLGETAYAGIQTCPVTAAKIVTGSLLVLTDKNPHDTTNKSVKEGITHTLGYVQIKAVGKTVTVKTCIKDKCDVADNMLTTVVSID